MCNRLKYTCGHSKLETCPLQTGIESIDKIGTAASISKHIFEPLCTVHEDIPIECPSCR